MKIKRVQEVEDTGIARKILVARKLSDKSLEQICKEVGVSRTYWYSIEKDDLTGSLSYANLKKIESVLDIELEIYFD